MVDIFDNSLVKPIKKSKRITINTKQLRNEFTLPFNSNNDIQICLNPCLV